MCGSLLLLASTVCCLWRRTLATSSVSATMGKAPSTCTGDILDGDKLICSIDKLDDVRSDGFLISSSHRVNGFWFVSDESDWRSMKAQGYMKSGNVLERVMAWVGKSDIPPEKGWKFATPGKTWSSDSSLQPSMIWSSTDSSLQCSRTPTSTCKVVTVKLAGEARDKQGEADGRYLVVEDSFIKGRRVSYISRPTQH